MVKKIVMWDIVQHCIELCYVKYDYGLWLV